MFSSALFQCISFFFSSMSLYLSGVSFRAVCELPPMTDTCHPPSTGEEAESAGFVVPCTRCQPISCPAQWHPICRSTEQVLSAPCKLTKIKKKNLVLCQIKDDNLLHKL